MDRDVPGRIDLAPGTWVHASDIQVSACRSGGPGGQHVNTTASAVQLRVQPHCIVGLSARAIARLIAQQVHRLDADGALLIRSEEHRSQSRNRQQCLEKLSAMIAEALPDPIVRRVTKPSRSSARRRLDGKRRTASLKSNRRVQEDE